MADLYVYYKVPVQHGERLLPQVRQMQADWASRLGIHGRLQRRPEATDGVETWMEVYPGADPGLAALLGAGTESIHAFLAGPRRCEVFVDFDDTPPCA